MNYRLLGSTGLRVSALSLGTASLGLDYGIAAPGEFGRPDEEAAVHLVRAALDRGITLIDTAPAYGNAERIVGRAIRSDSRAIIATKVSPPQLDAAGSGVGPTAHGGSQLQRSLESSLRALNRDVLDIVQVHNATRELIESPAMTDALLDVKRRGLLRVLGATVYGEDAALAVVHSGAYGVMQVALNALDRRMMRKVIPAAAASGIGVVVRSALLKGALTSKAQWLPDALAALHDASLRARDTLAGGSWDRLPGVAVRFCLAAPHVASVLAGPRTIAELDIALEAEAAGPLDGPTLTRAGELAIDDERLLDPSCWPVP